VASGLGETVALGGEVQLGPATARMHMSAAMRAINDQHVFQIWEDVISLPPDISTLTLAVNLSSWRGLYRGSVTGGR
jgi:hypothetical protein